MRRARLDEEVEVLISPERLLGCLMGRQVFWRLSPEARRSEEVPDCATPKTLDRLAGPKAVI